MSRQDKTIQYKTRRDLPIQVKTKLFKSSFVNTCQHISIYEKIRQDKTSQDRKCQTKTCQCKARQVNRRLTMARQCNTKYKIRQDLSRQDKTCHDNALHDLSKQDKIDQDKTCLDITRLFKTKKDKTNFKIKRKIMGTSFADIAQCVLVHNSIHLHLYITLSL